MIKLLLTLLLFIPTFGADKVFYLPNNHSALLDALSSYFKNAQSIIIVSPEFNHAGLKKKIEKTAHKGSFITIIVNEPRGDPLSMIQYQNIDLILSPTQLYRSTILVDERIVCNFDGKIDQENMSTTGQTVRCSDQRDIIDKQHLILKTLLNKGKPYLE